MEAGIKEAKNNLSKLLEAMREGESVYLTHRGNRVAQLIPARQGGSFDRGRGILKHKINLYPGWDSKEEDRRIEQLFETRDA